MIRNIGETSLSGKQSSQDPMRSYDALPKPVRHWLAQAALPWSPVSARKIWDRARAKGLNPDQALAMLARAENKTLSRDKTMML